MKKNQNKKKVLIAILLIVIFAMCFIPPKNNNSKYKLEIISSYGDNQAYHPKVLTFKEKWNGYKYWMSYTPYPKGDDARENPHIAVSNDLINWKAPNEKNVALDEPSVKISKKSYNSDSHIVYNNKKNVLECYWRYVNDVNNEVYIYKKVSSDGTNWSNKEVVAYSSDRKKKDYISPAIIYENGVYKIWYVDTKNVLTYATATEDAKWHDEKVIDLKYEKNLKTWHLDVISTNKGYEMIVVAFDKWDNHNDMSLYYSYSKDGISWSQAKVILKPATKTSNWDNKGIYRSTFIYENGKYYVYYGATSRDYNHGIGFAYGEDIFDLKGTNTNFKNKKEVEELIKKIK